MLVIKSKQIRSFEEKVLTSGLCDFTLPASFITTGGIRNTIYDSSGYTCLDDIAFRDLDNILELLGKTMVNLDKAGEYLIDPAHIVLDGSTVFQNLKKRDVKFAFVPMRTQKPRDNIINIIDYMEERAEIKDRRLINDLKKYIIGRDLPMREAARHISMIRRELKNREKAAQDR